MKNTEKKFVFEIGKLYTTRMGFLCSHQLVQDVYTTTLGYSVNSEHSYSDLHKKIDSVLQNSETSVEFGKMITAVSDNKLVNQEDEWIPVMLEYIGNGEFRELITGEKIICFVDMASSFECEVPMGYLNSYEEAIPYLNSLYEHPITIASNEDYYIRPCYDADKIDFLKKSLKEMEEILLAAKQKARDQFMESLRKFADVDYELANFERFVKQRIKK